MWGRIFLLTAAVGLQIALGQSTERRNVLAIFVDDLRPQLGCYNATWAPGKKMLTPNIDRLAQRGLTFRHAYDQYSVCSPSRNSFMSGRRPDTTLVYNFKDDFRQAPGGETWASLPEIFKINGYNTTGCGKTFHNGHPPKFDQPRSWTEGVEYVGYNQGIYFCGGHAGCILTPNETGKMTDDGLAARAIQLLRSHKDHHVSPFFVAVGFVRPHLDWSAPQRFWDLYEEDKIPTAAVKTCPAKSPKVAWVDGDYLDKKGGDLGKGYHMNATHPVPDTVAKKWRHGYYAAVSYVDWNIGKVLDALDELELANNTIVSLLSDHGYQLGEHSMWEKYTNWELATRVPLIISDPSKPASHGRVSSALVESVDLYPTLCAAAGITSEGWKNQSYEGFDASPLLEDPDRPWKKAVFSQYARCAKNESSGFYARCSGSSREEIQVMGYSVRSQDWRYVEWFKYNGTSLKVLYDDTIAVELYDHRGDTGEDFDKFETVNVADDPSLQSVVKEHAKIVREGWKKQLPQP